MKKSKVKHFIRNPKKALFKLAYPIVIAMFVQTLYNIVDTAFVGRLGAESIAALTFAFPLFFVLVAFNSGIGAGMGSRISRCLGAKQKNAAENTAMHGILFSVLFAVSMMVLGLIYLDDIFRLFGAKPEVMELATGYMSIIIYGSVFLVMSFVLNTIFSAQGDTKTPMIVQVSALIMNIILDPIFIYVLGYGVQGAAIATVISFTFSFFLFMMLLGRRSYLHIHIRNLSFRWRIIWDIIRVGAPASFTLLVMSIYMIVANRFMAHFSTNYVASFGIVARLRSVAVLPVVALSTAVMTLVGMFYGAHRKDLLKGIVWYSVKIGSLFMLGFTLLFFSWPWIFLRIFTPDPVLLGLASAYMRVEVFMLPIMGISMILSRAMQGMGMGMPSLVVNLVRVVVVAVPLAYALIFRYGYGYLALPFSMIMGAVVGTTISVVWFQKKLASMRGSTTTRS